MAAAVTATVTAASATVRVDKATSDLLIGPDWTLNMDICDSIDADRRLAKDVVKAAKKRLQNKKPAVQLLALTLLETMIKNCGDFVRLQVAEREVPQDMVKIVKKKADMQVRDKVLALIDSWQEAFGGPEGKYPQFYWAYVDLKKYGVEFPPRPADSALIFTPPGHSQIGNEMPGNSSMTLDEAMASESVAENLSLSELENFRDVACLLGDMLLAVDPKDSEAVRGDEVIADLISQCRSNQKRTTQLINSTADERLLAEGLALNDRIQSLLAKCDSMASGSSPPSRTTEPVLKPNTPPATAVVPVTNYEGEEDEENDEFVRLARRNSKSKALAAPTENALALPDPPAPIKAPTEERDLIDLLSITASSPAPLGASSTPPSFSSSSNGWQVPNAAASSSSSSSSQHSYEEYNPYNGYVASWARPPTPRSRYRPVPPPWEEEPQIHPQVPSPYPPPPWETSSAASAGSGPVPCSSAAPMKPYIPPYHMLFGDLMEPRSPGGGLKIAGSPPGLAGRGITAGRK